MTSAVSTLTKSHVEDMVRRVVKRYPVRQMIKILLLYAGAVDAYLL